MNEPKEFFNPFVIHLQVDFENAKILMNNLVSETSDLLERALFVLREEIFIVEKDATITYINTSAQDFLEKRFETRPEPGNNLLNFVATQRRKLHEECIAKAFQNECSCFDVEFDTAEGMVVYELHYHPLPDENAIITHAILRAKNITEKILLERKLKQERKARKNKVIKATIEAQEKERSLIGRELHDNVNQVLTTVKLYNEICYYDEVINKDLLKRSVQQINYCIEEIRSLSKRLSVPKLGELPLDELIKDLVETVNSTRKTSIEFLCFGIKDREFTQELQITIYRIVQEQLTNVIKYAHATSVKVIVAGTQNEIAVQVQDNGLGFDITKKKRGTGITNMIARTEILGGALQFETSPGNGCAMTAEFPLKNS